MRNSCVEGREVKCFNTIAGGEEPRLYVLLTDCMYSKCMHCFLSQIYIIIVGNLFHNMAGNQFNFHFLFDYNVFIKNPDILRGGVDTPVCIDL